MIYFDNAATTKPYPEALVTFQEVATKIFGNPSSLHVLGNQATRVLEASRRQIADLLGVTAGEIFFTSGGTESDNWAIKGTAFEKAVFGQHIIVSSIEHPAVRLTAAWLETQGFSVDFAPVDKAGLVDVAALSSLIRPDTILVSVMAVNNEVGTIQPLAAISELLADKPGITFHVDAVQAVGKLPLSQVLTDRVDLASFSSHKFHGLRGVGFLYKKSGKRLSPLLHGGGQESKLRSTTENLPAIAATSKALRLTLEKEESDRSRVRAMRDLLHGELAKFSDVLLFSGTDERYVPSILTFGLRGVRGEVVVHAFEEHDIYLSTTSACSSKAGQPAGTLVAMGVPIREAQTAVRISLDASNDMGQIEQFLTIFKQVYDKTKKVR